MITFKENTFVKGNYDELTEMAKAIEDNGGKIMYSDSDSNNFNHLWWYKKAESWIFGSRLNELCDHELTKAQLYEAYGIVDFSILNETDVFYVETMSDKYLIQGKHPFEIGERIVVVLSSDSIFTDNNSYFQSDKSRYKLIRLATPQEIEPYKEHFKLNNMETRPIQISQETATRWYNGEDNELKQLAIQTYPELDEATPKVGDLCLFSDNEKELNQGIGRTGTLKSSLSNGEFKFERKEGCKWKFCKKIKSIEFY